MPSSRAHSISALLFSSALTLSLGACESDDSDASAQAMEPFALQFSALLDGQPVGCGPQLGGFGPGAGDLVGITDLRFYISNLRFFDAQGQSVALELDVNEFQLSSPAGNVALVDLTGTTQGTCASTGEAAAESTPRSNLSIRGRTDISAVARIAFDVGVPQPLMKQTIATNSPESAPSPLGEMMWNWNSGYRHFVFNFSVADQSGAQGVGHVHVGSRDCGPKDGLALSDRESCTFLNTPTASIDSFDLASDVVGLELRGLLSGLDFRTDVRDPSTGEVIGEGPGVACHSSPMQPDCPSIFSFLGLDMATGAANPLVNRAFIRLPGAQ